MFARKPCDDLRAPFAGARVTTALPSMLFQQHAVSADFPPPAEAVTTATPFGIAQNYLQDLRLLALGCTVSGVASQGIRKRRKG